MLLTFLLLFLGVHTRVAGSMVSTMSSKNVLIFDALSEATLLDIQGIPNIGKVHVMDAKTRGDEKKVIETVREFQPNAVVVRSSKVTAEILDHCKPALEMVIRAGAGYNNIDVCHASSLDVAVCNTPGCNAIAVAELVMGLIIASDRKIIESTLSLKEGRWEKQLLAVGQRGLFGTTLGVIGAGYIGREVMKRALAFGIHIVVWSRRFQDGEYEITNGKALDKKEAKDLLGLDYIPASASVSIASTPKEVAASGCDYFTVHVSTTTPLIDAECIRALAPGTLVVNTARSSAIDNEELALHVQDPFRNLKLAADVWNAEPIVDEPFSIADNPLIKHENVMGTHHTGASTAQAQNQVAAEVIKSLRDWVNDDACYNHQVN